MAESASQEVAAQELFATMADSMDDLLRAGRRALNHEVGMHDAQHHLSCLMGVWLHVHGMTTIAIHGILERVVESQGCDAESIIASARAYQMDAIMLNLIGSGIPEEDAMELYQTYVGESWHRWDEEHPDS